MIKGAIRCGRYQHYKGREYQVLGVARHSETEEDVVVYRALYGRRQLWIRPLEMFVEQVPVAGRMVARFAFLGPMAEGDLPGGEPCA